MLRSLVRALALALFPLATCALTPLESAVATLRSADDGKSVRANSPAEKTAPKKKPAAKKPAAKKPAAKKPAAKKPAAKKPAAKKPTAKKKPTANKKPAAKKKPRKPRRKKVTASHASLSYRPHALAPGRRSVRRERALLRELDGEILTRRALGWRRQVLPPGSYLLFARPVARGGQELHFVDAAVWKTYEKAKSRKPTPADRAKTATAAASKKPARKRGEAEEFRAQGVRLRVPLRESVVEESAPALAVELKELRGDRLGFTLRAGQSAWQANLRFVAGAVDEGVKRRERVPGKKR